MIWQRKTDPQSPSGSYLATTSDASNFSQPLSFFSITPEKVDASFKLNQNKSREDRVSVANSLIETGSPADHAVAEMIRDNL